MTPDQQRMYMMQMQQMQMQQGGVGGGYPQQVCVAVTFSIFTCSLSTSEQTLVRPNKRPHTHTPTQGAATSAGERALVQMRHLLAS
jgi:hypothetical protein